MASKNQFSAFFTGAVFGSLVGAAVALLYAPQTGEETRTVIKEKTIELKDKAVESGEELRHRAEETAAQARARLEETAAATKERAVDLQHRSQSFLDEQRERIKAAIDAGKKTFTKEEALVVEMPVDEKTN